MGARSNIVVQDTDGSRVWLYGHWMGEDAIRITRSVLDIGYRNNDAPYLARMLFCEMVKDEPEGAATGFGISARMGDNEYPVTVIDVFTGRVHLEHADGSGAQITPAIPFELYVAAAADADDFDGLIYRMSWQLERQLEAERALV